MTLKADYEKIAKNHKGAPSWEWLDSNFSIKEEGNLTQSIRNSIMGKFMRVKDGIEPIISNTENYCSWFERKMLTKEERGELFELYKKLNYLLWASVKSDMENDEKFLFEWLVILKERWHEIKDPFIVVSEKLAIGWKEYKRIKEETAYHG